MSRGLLSNRGGASRLVEHGLQDTQASVAAAPELQSRRSTVVVHGLSCFAVCLPDPGIEPMSPALAGGFFTIEPPGEPCAGYFTHSFLQPSGSSYCSLLGEEIEAQGGSLMGPRSHS